MRFFRNYIFPVLFGLLIYTSIRLVTDSMSGEQFLERSFMQNAVEVLFSILLGFISDILLRKAIKGFDRRKPKLSLKTIVREFGFICIVCLLIFNPILFLIHYLIDDPVDWADAIIGNILVLLYALLYYAIERGNSLLKSYVAQQTQIEKIRREQLETELKFLKAQYHPHFLFNALNTIYFQMDENVAKAKETVEKFSELLRYQLYDHDQKLPLQQELNYLGNFIYLQKARSSEKLQLELNIEESSKNEKIYPLLFLPLVENAFKYVGGDYHISIKIESDNRYLSLEVRNSVPEITSFRTGGIGLENLRRRLELLYPGDHHLSVEKLNGTFIAVLRIPVDEN
ncbi:MAG: sensor histidine kinase [Flavisolibacter sp.]